MGDSGNTNFVDSCTASVPGTPIGAGAPLRSTERVACAATVTAEVVATSRKTCSPD